jgi:hypothetical protein
MYNAGHKPFFPPCVIHSTTTTKGGTNVHLNKDVTTEPAGLFFQEVSI